MSLFGPAALPPDPPRIGTSASAERMISSMLIHGTGVSSGRSAGPVFIVKEPGEASGTGVSDLGSAVDSVAKRLEALARRTSTNREGASILEAQAAMVRDPALLSAVEEELGRGADLPRAVTAAAERYAQQLEALEDDYVRARAADVREIGRLLSLEVTGAVGSRLAGLGHPSIVVARELSPADMLEVDTALLLGLVTEFGGRTSHAAIVARELGIPAVVGAAGAVSAAIGHPMADIDGDSGQVRFADRVTQEVAAAPTAPLDLSALPVRVMANVGSLEAALVAARRGAAGVGLFRTEFMFMAASGPMPEEEQFAIYASTCAAFAPHPVVVRTLDAGADKPLPYRQAAREVNPQLGRRGVRLWVAAPELWRPQVRALLRTAAVHPNLKVMVPMVAAREEMTTVRRRFASEARRLGAPVPELGMMVEVPAAAVALEAFRGVADFVSLGTNDLTQYTVAADRELVWEEYLSGTNPGVLRLICIVTESAARLKMNVGVCGEMAAHPPAAVYLVGAGVDSLSMTVDAIPAVVDAIRRLGADGCRKAAAAALRATTAAAASARLQQALAGS